MVADEVIIWLETFEKSLLKEQYGDKGVTGYLSKIIAIGDQRHAITETINAIKFWQEKIQMTKERVTLSASKIKTGQSCSYKYWASYCDPHLPDRGNLGSQLGGVSHTILECLALPRRRKLVEEILEQRDIFHGLACQGIKKLVYKLLHKKGIAIEENVEKVKAFVINGFIT